jgi:phospholipase/carboxylesterase
MLEYDVAAAGEPADGTVLVLLHGRGADRSDMRALAGQLPRSWTTVLPNAPHRASPWGYGPGYAWYRYLGGTVPEPESFRTSLAELDTLLAALHLLVGFEPSRVVLGGFSQGGTVSMAYGLSRPGRISHALNFSGFLADHPDVHVQPGAAAGLRIFWGHGFSDGNIPFSFAESGRAALEGAGALVEARDYPIGHWIDPLELAHAVAFVK